MVLSGQALHAMATLTAEKEFSLPIEQGASWVPRQALRLRQRKKSPVPSNDRATTSHYPAQCSSHNAMLIWLLQSHRIILNYKFIECENHFEKDIFITLIRNWFHRAEFLSRTWYSLRCSWIVECFFNEWEFWVEQGIICCVRDKQESVLIKVWLHPMCFT